MNYPNVNSLRAAHAFNNLQEFLDLYYTGMSVLLKRDGTPFPFQTAFDMQMQLGFWASVVLAAAILRSWMSLDGN
jgi:hypothetical protein